MGWIQISYDGNYGQMAGSQLFDRRNLSLCKLHIYFNKYVHKRYGRSITAHNIEFTWIFGNLRIAYN